MKKKLNLLRFLCICIGIIGSVFITASCNSPKKETKETFDMASGKKGIEEQNFIFTKAMNKSDSLAVINCYKTDARFMPPIAKATIGRNNILNVISVFMKVRMLKFSLKTLIVWGNNEMLISEDKRTFTDKKDKEFDRQKSLVV